MKQTIDLEKLYRHQLGNQPTPSAARWAELFGRHHAATSKVERDAARTEVILQALAFVRKYNARTPQFIADDVAMYATQRVIIAVDHCLATRLEPDKASAYIRQTAINEISSARKGKVPKFVSTNVRTSEPRTCTNRELETRLRQSGLSDSMVESELFSAGYQPCGRTRAVQDQWPVRNSDGQSLDFAGNFSGKRRKPQHKHGGSTDPTAIESMSLASDDWQHLEEILTTEQCDYLRLRAEGYTQEDIENDFQVSAAEQQRIMRAIRKRTADYQRQHSTDV
jgi:hypothetical protein